MKRNQRVSIILVLGVIVSALLAASLGVVPASANGFSCLSVTDVPTTECDELVALYDSTNTTPWTTSTNWEVSTTVCNWHGITCDSGGDNVEDIFLYNNNLNGAFAGDFSGFTALTAVRLGRNELTGDIATDIIPNLPSATLVTLDLSSNQITGTIPDITSFSSLIYLYLQNNQLAGQIESIIPNLPTSLVQLYLGHNNQSGYVPDMTSFTNLTSLEINDEGLTGYLGATVGNLPHQIENLYLSNNSLEGNIPVVMIDLSQLSVLELSSNLLSGDITTTFGYLSDTLHNLDLSSNDFTGTIPADVSGMTNLAELSVSDNQLNGDLTAIINNLPTSVNTINLNTNQLTGSIPSSISTHIPFYNIDVGDNNLTGNLTTIIGYIPTSVYNIYLDDNNFTGGIPASIQNYTSLSTLMLSGNAGLTGMIPTEITNLSLYRLNFYGTNMCEPDTLAYHTWTNTNVTFYTPGICLRPFNGGVEITAGGPIVAIGRPHIGSEIMAYNGINAGALKVYLPMLFNNTWGNYTSSFTVQNVSAGIATFSLEFRDAQDGSLDCTISGQQLPSHGIKTYDVTNLPACDSGSLPAGWYGGATINSNSVVTAVARPNINGSDAVTYNGFTSGATTVYLPMLFRGMWGYQSAFYVQNLDPAESAQLDIMFYDNQGNFTCELLVTDAIQAAETRGFWMSSIPNTDCQGGDPGFSSSGWAGNAVIEVNGGGSTSIVAIARPHMGSEVAAYNGFTSGSTVNYLPMLFRNKWGYNAAFYIQNLGGTPSNVKIEFFDTDGNYTCKYEVSADIGSNATRGYWTPALICTDGSFPAEWAGSAKITTSNDAAIVGRPHLTGGQVVAYNAFPGGVGETYLPMLFRQYSGNESAVYVQNLDTIPRIVTFTFYDEETEEYCTYQKSVAPNVSAAVWLANLDGVVCIP